MSPWALNRLGHALSAGAVIGYPTDTIWGFGCDPLNFDSVARILQIKNRSPDKGLILLSSKLEYCAPYIDVDDAQRDLLLTPRAQPTTWLVKASEHLCSQLMMPLVSTSANRSGRSTVRSALQLQRQFGDELDYIVTGFSAGSGRPSEIKSLASGTTLRSSS
jgi:L-threonylcarbamoyladenylate synthase